LIWDAPIYRDETLEPGSFRRVQELSILQSRQVGEAGSLTIVPGKKEPQTIIDTFVKKKFHEARESNSCLASSRALSA
jgi:hypothetical protein